MPKKPKWVMDKERAPQADKKVWLFGVHAVRDALTNPARRRHRLVVTRNAADKLADAISQSAMSPEVCDPRKFNVPLDPQSVHQGAALQVDPLVWPSLSELCAPRGHAPLVLLLDRVSDPHNVGAILRSAEVFGATAVVAPFRHSAPETGALAKTASGALERQAYLRVQNLAKAIRTLQDMGYFVVGLEGVGQVELDDVLFTHGNMPLALVLGSEGAGLRDLTAKSCDAIARIPFARDFGSLNVSNAAAVALYAASKRARP